MQWSKRLATRVTCCARKTLLLWSLQHRRRLRAGLGAWHRFRLPCGRISGRVGIHAEVPNVEVHFFCVQHFDERIFAWYKRLGWSDVYSTAAHRLKLRRNEFLLFLGEP